MNPYDDIDLEKYLELIPQKEIEL